MGKGPAIEAEKFTRTGNYKNKAKTRVAIKMGKWAISNEDFDKNKT